MSPREPESMDELKHSFNLVYISNVFLILEDISTLLSPPIETSKTKHSHLTICLRFS